MYSPFVYRLHLPPLCKICLKAQIWNKPPLPVEPLACSFQILNQHKAVWQGRLWSRPDMQEARYRRHTSKFSGFLLCANPSVLEILRGFSQSHILWQCPGSFALDSVQWKGCSGLGRLDGCIRGCCLIGSGILGKLYMPHFLERLSTRCLPRTWDGLGWTTD